MHASYAFNFYCGTRLDTGVGIKSERYSSSVIKYLLSLEMLDKTPLENIVCYSRTFENNLRIKQKFTTYLKQGYCVAPY